MFKFLIVILVLLSGNECSQRYDGIKLFDFEKFLKSKSFTSLLHSGKIGEPCRSHFEKLLKEIGETWALQMMDSITKAPDGLMLGRLHFPGHFDECVKARNDEFKGQHCMLEMSLDSQDGKDSAQNRNTTLNNFSYSFGICVPSTCNVQDINSVIKNVAESIKFIKIESLTDVDCSTDEFRPLRTEDWVAIGVVGAFIFLALASTAYDVAKRFGSKNENPNELLSSFSLYTNGKYLFSISQSTAQLKCLHGIRVFSIAWVVMGHTYAIFIYSIPYNIVDYKSFITSNSYVLANNAFVAVDTFLFLSGLLVCLVFFRSIQKKGSFDVPVAYIHRYMRLTPPFAIMMFLQATILTRIGNGPIWNRSIDKTEDSCRKIWWTGLLYVQNYVEPEAQNCLGQSWYLSADMQMYWLSPLILYPMLLWPTSAPLWLLVLLVGAAATNFVIAYLNELYPNLGIAFVSDSSEQFKIEYIPFHTRMAPWLIGLATGYLLCGIQAKKIRINLSKPAIVFGWIVAFGLCSGSFFGIFRFFSFEYTPLESAFYLAFHRIGWALGLSWIVIACVCGYGGPINYILSLDIFQPLSKLSYCNYLIHMSLQDYRLFSTRINHYFKYFNLVYDYIGDLALSFVLSVPCALLFEIPFVLIDRFLFQDLTIMPLPKKFKNKSKDCDGKEKQISVEGGKDVEKGNDDSNLKKFSEENSPIKL